MFYQYPAIGDENIFQEFCKDVYNEIYKTTSFQLYKTKGAAQFGIDAYSIDERIVIQSKKKKLLRSDKDLEKELVEDLTETVQMIKNLPFEFDQLIFATNTKRYSAVEDLAATLSQSGDFQIKFASWENFETNISDYPEVRKKYFPAYYREPGIFPKILTYLPPIDPETVIGRESEFDDICKRLDSNKPLVLVNGMGGIGKTTIVKLILHKALDRYDHVLWIDHSASLNEDNHLMADFTSNFALLANVGISYTSEQSPEELMKLIMTRLANLTGRNLLIIDNAPQSLLSINHLLPGLPNWQKLITSRLRLFEENTFELTFLDLPASISLFLKHYFVENNTEQISSIVVMVGYHTLTIELLAKTANKRRLRLAELIQMLELQGLNISKTARITSDHDTSGTPITLFNYLLSIFSIAELDSHRQYVLSCFSVLSNQYVDYEDLKLLFHIGHDDNNFFDILNDLFETGWLLQRENQYAMHQVIQEVVREKTQPTVTSLQELIAALADLVLGNWGSNPLNSKRFIQHGLQVLNVISISSVASANLSNALGLRQEDFGDFDKALKNYQAAEYFYESDPALYEDDLAGIYNNLQSVYKELGQIEKAFTYQERAIEIQERILPAGHFDLGASYNNIALLYDIMGQSENALKCMARAVAIAEAGFETEHPNLASTYSTYSILLSHNDDDRLALSYQLLAYEMRKRVLEEGHPQLDESRNNLAALYEAVDELDKAEQLLKEALEFRKKHFGEDAHQLGTVYNNLAAIYIKKGNFIQAEIYQLQAIQMETDGLGEHHHELGVSYSTLAVIKDGLKQYAQAIAAAQKAIDIFQFNFPGGHPSIDVYNQFIDIIKGKVPVSRPKIGRNNPCTCGSGKKYKNCCGGN